MSREERRQYQRLMKGADRSGLPPVSPAARARMERARARRESKPPAARGAFTRRFWLGALVIALLAGLLGLSLAWPNGMPFALYVGIAVGLAAVALQVGFRLLQGRLPGR